MILYVYSEKVFSHSVFAYQFLQGLVFFLAFLFLNLWSKHLCCRKQIQDTNYEGDYTYGKERKEAKGLISCRYKCVADNKVGRCTDEGHHSSHAAGKRKRHEQTA